MPEEASIDKAVRDLLETKVRHLPRAKKLEFAASIGVTLRTVQSLLSGGRNPGKHLVDKIFEYFKSEHFLQADAAGESSEPEGNPFSDVVPTSLAVIQATLSGEQFGSLPSRLLVTVDDEYPAFPVEPGDTILVETDRRDFLFESPFLCAILSDGGIAVRNIVEIPDTFGVWVYSDKAGLRNLAKKDLRQVYVGKVVTTIRHI